ncbi:uncharacterized protein [Solanum tuberosum]|uniref:Cysteine-type peptidase n=1 Tax=Solanum tuberosum TaxID=4113 RepID=M1CHT5_SOLTU|nr:PREDICTED: uncharacterized protein LOC102597381 isoform X2 [Solanum tuberosum]
MTRILVQRGSAGASSSSSSNQNRSSTSLPGSSSSSAPTQPLASSSSQVLSALKDDDFVEEIQEQVALEESSVASSNYKGDGELLESLGSEQSNNEEKIVDNEKRNGGFDSEDLTREFDGLGVVEEENEESSVQRVACSSCPPPPPVPPPKPASLNSSPRRFLTGSSHAIRIGSSRGTAGRSTFSTRTSPAGSRPSSPRSHCESEGYNSADEQNPNFGSSYDDVERERDHFSQFIIEGFTSYCKRKRRDKVYGNNVEIQALSEMYNRPIHIYSYSTEPINTFHGSYNTDSPPVRLSFHHGNHYNSLVDPRRLTVGAGLGFSSLQGRNVDKDQVKAAIKAQQDQQIDNALLAEGRFYSDLELTEKEIERMVVEASRAEYVSNDKFRQQLGCRETSTSSAEPSSSGARSSGSDTHEEGSREVLSDCIQIMLSMGFSYGRVIEAYSIFGDDVDSMVCYLIETSNSSRRKGKATE